MLMKPQQCVAARELLGISPEILAGYAGVSESSIIGFEEMDSEIPRSIAESIQVALEYAGVEFLDPNESERRLVRLRVHYAPTPAGSISHSSEIHIRSHANEIRD
jgi:transcriptional regulator with XRE-family HTH domain